MLISFVRSQNDSILIPHRLVVGVKSEVPNYHLFFLTFGNQIKQLTQDLLSMENQFKNNAIRGPINSWLLRIMSAYMHYKFGESKKNLFQNHPDKVVEIGSGTGENMRYLRKGTHLIAIEPNVHMHASLKKTADKYGINLEIRSLIGEAIDLDDESCEFVISTLVLCTVCDLQACLQQVKRILKPGGEFVFIEHVKAKEKTFLSLIQNLLHKPWH